MKIRELSRLDTDFLVKERVNFPDGWNKEMIENAFLGGRFFGFIAEEDGKNIGFITCSAGLDTVDIESVYVIKEKRHKGVASALIKNALQKAGNKRVLLEVRSTNTFAIGLYKKYGFIEISVRKKYYSNGEDALVMEKKI